MNSGWRVARKPSLDSSPESSSASDEEEYPSRNLAKKELTLQDDESTGLYQALVPEDYEEPGESDNENHVLPRDLQSSASDAIDSDKKLQMNKRRRKRVYFICVSMCKYECVRRAAKRLNFREVADDDDWNIYWTDTSVGIERVSQMNKWQKINHFPGMSEICRKDSLTRNMSRMQKMFPKEYAFYPKAWCLPADYNDFLKYYSEKKGKTFISKPDVGCQGRGIFITKNPAKDIKPTDNFVVQVYINRPFLVDGFKFDFRVYVAVTSCDPFRVFVYKDGLARFTTQQYEEPSHSNCKDIFMHLTNYAIQKRSEDFIRDEDAGTKRRISTINRWLVEHGYDIDKLWSEIDDVIIKVLISAHPILKHNYRSCFPNHYRGSACFEILGFDILLDRKLKPCVLEVNHSPSFTTDSKLDRDIKDALIYDTLQLLNLPAADKRRFIEEEKKRVKERLFCKSNKKDSKYREEQEDLAQQWQKEIEKWEDQHIGNYRRIYPTPDTTVRYEQFFTQSGTLYSETAASKARIEQAKAQINELQKKNDRNLPLKSNKSQPNGMPHNQGDLRGESPTRKTLPIVKSSRSSSFNRTQLKRLTTNIHIAIAPGQTYGDTSKPMDIDESEELERILALKHRETLIRGMGIIDICHRMLFATPGTMANVPTNNNSHAIAHRLHHSIAPNDPMDPSQNLSLLQYVNSKLPQHSLNRDNLNNAATTQALHKYFASQQYQLKPKYEVRTARNVHIFDETLGNMGASQNGSRTGRYQPALRSIELNPSLTNNNSRYYVQTNPIPQIPTNANLPKSSMAISNGSVDGSTRTKSAHFLARQRTDHEVNENEFGGYQLINSGSNDSKSLARSDQGLTIND